MHQRIKLRKRSDREPKSGYRVRQQGADKEKGANGKSGADSGRQRGEWTN